MRLEVVFLVITLLITGVAHASAQSEQQQPTPAEKNPLARVLIQEALRLEKAGEFDQAIAKFKEVLKLEPKETLAMNSIAGLYGISRRPAEQIVWAQKALDIDPKFWKALVNLGNGYAVQGKFDMAADNYKKAAELAPADPLPVYSLGVIEEERGRSKEALALYLKSVQLDPKFQNGIFSAAAMHANLKQFREAKLLLVRLIEINPRDNEARAMLQQIERELAKP